MRNRQSNSFTGTARRAQHTPPGHSFTAPSCRTRLDPLTMVSGRTAAAAACACGEDFFHGPRAPAAKTFFIVPFVHVGSYTWAVSISVGLTRVCGERIGMTTLTSFPRALR